MAVVYLIGYTKCIRTSSCEAAIGMVSDMMSKVTIFWSQAFLKAKNPSIYSPKNFYCSQYQFMHLHNWLIATNMNNARGF